jgi:hypothetical protein
MKTQTTVKRPSIHFIKISKIDKISTVRLEELFWAGNKVGCSEQMIKGSDFRFGLWRLHTTVVQVERPWEFMAKGLDFGLGFWRLHTMPGQRIQITYFIGYY